MTRHAAGVGKIDRQSPVLTTRVVDINFNPFWTVPASIIRKDLIPKMQADPNYLTENKIRIFKQPDRRASARAGQLALGRGDPVHVPAGSGRRVQLAWLRAHQHPNPYGVYMHDTPSKGIFGDDFRFVSSGCMRVQNVRDYITWLLRIRPAGPASRSTRRSSAASASTHALPSPCRSTGSTSRPGRRPMVSCSSATTSTIRTASARCRWQPCSVRQALTTKSRLVQAGSGLNRRCDLAPPDSVADSPHDCWPGCVAMLWHGLRV